ncbi:MAG: RNA polymerase sporulation sigma factor SigG [Clostridia bacterium]|nr:RNA polymerase sporulation sigma factor SigG [Clostridia bacterium]
MFVSRPMGKVEICGVNTAKLKTLSDEEKRTLLLRAQKGDASAREALILGNLRLVLSIVGRFGSRRECSDDLFQVGCIGLMKAIDRFDTTLDVKFSTYAVPMIAGELRRYLRDNSAIRISRSLKDMAYRCMQARESLCASLGREPSTDEIASLLGERREVVSRALEATYEPVSLYDSVYSDGDDTVFVIDQIKDTENTDEAWIENIALKDALKKLGERERHIIEMRFYRARTQMEVAAELGISQAQVSRLEKSALDKIRKSF